MRLANGGLSDSTMKNADVYLVTSDGVATREYALAELVWLWRTAQLPAEAHYRDRGGEWRPVAGLVESMSAREAKGSKRAVKAAAAKARATFRMRAAVVAVLLGSGLMLAAWRLVPHYREKAAAEEREQQAVLREDEVRLREAIDQHQVFPGMTREQVQRSWGTPQSVKTQEAPRRETWTYRGYEVEFEDGAVIRLVPSG